MMKDQADALRNRVTIARKSRSVIERDETKVIGVVSGKGGVGKSNFVVNFSLELQNQGQNVLIFDLDIGMANIDILLGQTSRLSIVDLLEGELPIWDIVEKTPDGISYIAGGSGLRDVFEMNDHRKEHFMSQLQVMNEHYDYIIFDMGAGASKSSFQFLLAAHEIILLTTPEPTSVTDAYAMIKHIHVEDGEVPLSIVVNRTLNKNEGNTTAQNILNVSTRFLQKEVHYLGAIPDDNSVRKAVRSQRPFILDAPNSKPAAAIKKIAKNYTASKYEEEIDRYQYFLSKVKRLFKS